MSFVESIKLAFNSLMANKLRFFLTMLGIIIGISSVITITTIGHSLEKTISKSLNEAGTNLIEVYTTFTGDEEEYYEPEDGYIPAELVNQFLEEYPDEFELYQNNQLTGGTILNPEGKEVKYSIYANSQGAIQTAKLKILRGRNITKADQDRGSRVCVVSDKFIEKYFTNGENPIEQNITLTIPEYSDETFTIIGTYEYHEQKFMGISLGDDSETPIYIPYLAYTNITREQVDSYEYLTFMWNTKYDFDELNAKLEDFFTSNYENDRFAIETYNMNSMFDEITKVIGYITIAISVIAAISLLVGGVGVMNIMLVSVIERTREIGIEKALGATNKDIKHQFLIESVTICLIGGIIGILIGIFNGFLIGKIIENVMSSKDTIIFSISPNPGAIIISTLFSILIGVFFGSYPANKAAKLNPIDALRYE